VHTGGVGELEVVGGEADHVVGVEALHLQGGQALIQTGATTEEAGGPSGSDDKNRRFNQQKCRGISVTASVLIMKCHLKRGSQRQRCSVPHRASATLDGATLYVWYALTQRYWVASEEIRR
jgi:hypothetical protein